MTRYDDTAQNALQLFAGLVAEAMRPVIRQELAALEQDRQGSEILAGYPERMTKKQVASVLGCSPVTVKNMERRGELKGGLRIGKDLTFPKAEVIKLLKQKSR